MNDAIYIYGITCARACVCVCACVCTCHVIKHIRIYTSEINDAIYAVMLNGARMFYMDMYK